MHGNLLIVSNNLRDHLGHYFETSISLSEAARRLGWRPVLATHVHCRPEILPNWLESHPLFHTDCAAEDRPADDPFGGCSPSRLRRGCGRAWRACASAAWAADRAAHYLLPPLFYDLGRLIGYCGLPRWAQRRHRAELCAAIDWIERRRGAVVDPEIAQQVECWPEVSRRLRDPRQRRRIIEAAHRLAPFGFGRELEEMLCFQRDLLRFLARAGAGPRDHVLLGTAHPREAAAVRLAIDLLGRGKTPTFHLEFLNGLFEGDPAAEASTPSPNLRVRRLMFSLASRWGRGGRVRFYTDTRTLSDDYHALSGERFDVLPIPFRAELISAVARPAASPVRLAYFGEARDEKGFPWLPDLAEALRRDYLAPGRARLSIQANVSLPQYNPQSVKALERLGRFSPREVQLFAVDAPLSPVEYYRRMSQADVVLLPYLNGRYRACSSGVFAEARAMGAPAIVPAGTWMADQLPPGGGETFDDFDSFVRAVQRVLDNFPSYRSAAQADRGAWRRRHSPDALIAALTGTPRSEIPPADSTTLARAAA